MANLLPEKLTTLRKRYHYAQGDVAAKIGVSVAEYMKWENGSSLCRIGQLAALAELYGIPVQSLADNLAVLELPDPEHDYDDIRIPTFSGTVTGSGVELDQAQAAEIMYGMPSSEDSVEIPLADDVSYRQPARQETVRMPAVGDTQQISDTREFASTRVIQISDIPQNVPMVKEQPKDETPKANKAVYVAIAVILALAAGLLHLLGDKENKDEGMLALSQEDRLVLGERFSGYVDGQYRITTMGTTAELSAFTDLVKISAGPDYLLGLKRDGSAVKTGKSLPEGWDDLVDIAAGTTHLAAVKEDGTVLCSGSEDACDVAEWTDVVSVYAGNEITAGLTRDGKLLVSGKADYLEETDSVKDLALNKDGAVVLYQDGTIRTYGSLSGLNVSVTGAAALAAGDDFAAVLDSGGYVHVFSKKPEFGKPASSWSGIRQIAARGKTLVAVNAQEQIIGLGDNFYKVYNETAEEPSSEATKLPQVDNVRITATASGLMISWDAVENTKYYEVVVSTDPETRLNSAAASARISADKLIDGQTYTIAITPMSGDKDLYENGETRKMTYVYEAAQVQLDAPQNVRTELNGTTLKVTWNSVNKADYYNVAIETMVQKSTTNSITLDVKDLTDDKKYTVYVTAMSNDSRYTESNGGQADFTYHAPVVIVKLPTPEITTLQVEDNNDWTIRWNAVEHAAVYKVSVGEISFEQVADTQVTVPAAQLENGVTYKILITAMPSDTAKYNNSDPARESHLYTAHQPEPTASPEPTESPEPSEEPSPEPSESTGTEGGDNG